MTSAELRRLAARKLAEATALAADAGRLRGQAAALRGLLDPVVPMSTRVWVGPAAADFETNVRLHSQQIDLQAERLMRIGGEFDGEAAGLRREAAALQNQADLQSAADLQLQTGLQLQAGSSEATALGSPVIPGGGVW